MTDRASFAGIFFDLDGTLADTIDVILRSYRHTMRTHLGEELPDERWLETIGIPLPVQLGGFARSEQERLDMLQTYVAYQRSIHDDLVRPFPGVRRVLGELRARGLPIAVVTSKGSSIARRTMKVCGLWEDVDCVVAGDEVERGKPDPEPVLKALRALDLEARPSDVLFVGDAPVDLRAGRAAGTRTAAVSWGPHEPEVLRAEEPDYFFEDIEDVLDVMPSD